MFSWYWALIMNISYFYNTRTRTSNRCNINVSKTKTTFTQISEQIIFRRELHTWQLEWTESLLYFCCNTCTHCKTLYVPCMKIKLNKPIYVCYFPQIMLFFLNHQSLHCQASEEILESVWTRQWTSKHSLYHLDFYFCCLFWRPTPAPSQTGITSHRPGVVQLKWIKMAFVNGIKNVILMSDQLSAITVRWLAKIIWNFT